MFPLLTNPIGELKISIEIEPDDVQDQIVHKLDLGNFQDFEAKVQKLILDGVKAGYPLSPLCFYCPLLSCLRPALQHPAISSVPQDMTD